MLHHDQPAAVAAAIEAFLAGMIAQRLAVRSQRGAYVALVVLTLIWGSNWIVMKLALARADPVVFNIQRTWVAIAVLFAVLVSGGGGRLLPESWVAVVVTGFFQTTINFGSTTMALAGGGAGRTSVLVFTMPFWTLLLRLAGAAASACAGCSGSRSRSRSPASRWSSSRGTGRASSRPKLWAVLSGFGWAAGTIAIKYFQRARGFDMLNFIAWQMLVGVLPLCLLPLRGARCRRAVERDRTRCCCSGPARSRPRSASCSGSRVLRFLPAGTASLNMLAIPVIALLSSMLVFGERLDRASGSASGASAPGSRSSRCAAWLASRRGERPAPEPMPLEGG